MTSNNFSVLSAVDNALLSEHIHILHKSVSLEKGIIATFFGNMESWKRIKLL